MKKPKQLVHLGLYVNHTLVHIQTLPEGATLPITLVEYADMASRPELKEAEEAKRWSIRKLRIHRGSKIAHFRKGSCKHH